MSFRLGGMLRWHVMSTVTVSSMRIVACQRSRGMPILSRGQVLSLPSSLFSHALVRLPGLRQLHVELGVQ